MLKIGPAKGCKGCDADSSVHNAECIGFGAAPPTPAAEPPTFVMPEILGDQLDDVEYTLTVLSDTEETEESIPICPPPCESDNEERVSSGMAALLDITRDALFCNAPEEPVQEVFAAAAAAAAAAAVQASAATKPSPHLSWWTCFV